LCVNTYKSETWDQSVCHISYYTHYLPCTVFSYSPFVDGFSEKKKRLAITYLMTICVVWNNLLCVFCLAVLKRIVPCVRQYVRSLQTAACGNSSIKISESRNGVSKIWPLVQCGNSVYVFIRTFTNAKWMNRSLYGLYTLIDTRWLHKVSKMENMHVAWLPNNIDQCFSKLSFPMTLFWVGFIRVPPPPFYTFFPHCWFIY
jgi:hypothetical protein